MAVSKLATKRTEPLVLLRRLRICHSHELTHQSIRNQNSFAATTSGLFSSNKSSPKPQDLIKYNHTLNAEPLPSPRPLQTKAPNEIFSASTIPYPCVPEASLASPGRISHTLQFHLNFSLLKIIFSFLLSKNLGNEDPLCSMATFWTGMQDRVRPRLSFPSCRY
jgi:hypothetical protein